MSIRYYRFGVPQARELLAGEPGAEPRGVVLADDDLAGRRRRELDQQLALGVRPEPGDRGGAHQVLAVDAEELGPELGLQLGERLVDREPARVARDHVDQLVVD